MKRGTKPRSGNGIKPRALTPRPASNTTASLLPYILSVDCPISWQSGRQSASLRAPGLLKWCWWKNKQERPIISSPANTMKSYLEVTVTNLHAIFAEFLFPVNRASLDALNSISLFTSSSVTGKTHKSQKQKTVHKQKTMEQIQGGLISFK